MIREDSKELKFFLNLFERKTRKFIFLFPLNTLILRSNSNILFLIYIISVNIFVFYILIFYYDIIKRINSYFLNGLDQTNLYIFDVVFLCKNSKSFHQYRGCTTEISSNEHVIRLNIHIFE